MTLTKYYLRAAIYPSIFVQVLSIVYTIIDNYHYQSEWLTVESVIFMTVLLSLIFSVLICLLSLTIFLNKVEKLKNKLLWNVVTWFLLPGGCIVSVLIHEIILSLTYDLGFRSDFIYILIMTVPYMISLGWTFAIFRRN